MKKVIFFGLIFLSVLGCNRSEINNSNDNINLIQETPELDSFSVFVSKFKAVDLPFKLCKGDNNWIDFYDDNDSIRINKEEIIKFLYSNDSLEYVNLDCYQYFYGFKFNVFNDLVALIFYRVCENEYAGYELMLFNSEGKKVESCFFSGSNGKDDTEIQIESEINNKLEISTTIISIESDNNSDTFLASEMIKMSLITNTGKIVLIYESDGVVGNYKFNEKYRIVKN